MEYGRYDLSDLTKSSLSIKTRQALLMGYLLFLCVDGDLQTGLEFDHSLILVDGDLTDELSHHV
jgi:hypothetical protein